MTDQHKELDRRVFLAGAVGAAAALGALGAVEAQPPAGSPPAGGRPPAGGPPRSSDATLSTLQQAQPRLYRLEADVHDCEVTGKIPSDLNGAFYRVGPDAQYPMRPGNIPFDGEGHVSMFRIKDGRVNYRSRFVRNERYLAQEKAGRILFPMYRNPAQDDPSVKGVSRSTANTHIINHRNLLLSLKEDSPPSALNLLTLETVAPTYTFDGQLPSKTFTAHPKLDSHTGNMVAFGYESEGHGSNVVTMFEFTPQGRKVWDAKIQVPYVGMLHDFAVTENYIVFYVIPMTMDQAQMDKGGIHWSWDNSKPTYFGFVRRGGDGKDVRWIEGPTRSATHVMGAFDNKQQLIVDVEMSMSNPFPFMPMHDGTRWDPIKGTSHITRLTVDLSKRRPSAYGIEQLYPHVGALPRQDDRYNTVPYRYGFLGCPDPGAQPGTGGACYSRFDHQNRTWTLFNAGTDTTLAENVFAPRSQNAPEASGYLMGLATRLSEGGRSDLVILDAERLQDGARRGRPLADARAGPSARLVGAGVAAADGLTSRDLFGAAEQGGYALHELAAGARLLRGFACSVDEDLKAAVAAIATAAPFRHMETPGGFRMSVAMTNSGAYGWTSSASGYRYAERDPSTDAAWPAIPPVMLELARTAAATAGFAGFTPNACLVNRYEPGARLTLHQDKDERDLRHPIVSVSLGVPAVFLFGGLKRNERPLRLELVHGDVVVWGGPSRLRYHGVAPLKEAQHPFAGAARINLTLRRAG